MFRCFFNEYFRKRRCYYLSVTNKKKGVALVQLPFFVHNLELRALLQTDPLLFCSTLATSMFFVKSFDGLIPLFITQPRLFFLVRLDLIGRLITSIWLNTALASSVIANGLLSRALICGKNSTSWMDGLFVKIHD